MTINCKGQLIDLSTPKVMGILNVTPDSFYDGGRFVSEKNVLIQVENMLQDGANFIDIGGQSSKSKAAIVSIDEELKRVVSIVDLILKKFPETMISIDTFNSKVAQIAVENGAAIINDISAGNLDDNMFETIAKLQVPYIMMHMRGTPQTMQEMTNYDDLLKDILFYFSEKVAKARSFGINDLIIDPGFGFAKTLEQNFELLNKLELFEILELPILVGVSRKSMIYKTLETTPENALNGTSVLNTISLTKGGNILRVHDVKEAVECVKLYAMLDRNMRIIG
ncbi:dihydropteroate synthase [Flavobacterium psychrophilum FPG101]|uniref:dihydropteroate synthase n=1 Tax=Flavobacterium psychrophilum TaxID=96345 RepID=UPI0004F82915|nr:dihydropteroate synthase [Flavobacterium psychrophilum]AIN72075.1 dihydropteroate synthase [Flavobacterium psychrophilum FPG101]EKT4508949.1 dihydropteroate synthase [Flavobacterium psychrophilum]EKT4534890.1 dihydropteroate synthase [Flavobacterium psychrophilum]EKT4545453.1 dihydropteroate synthase [Flavobacterium psychrophilum]OJH12158.1 dihydropteroate synthase [Flavobacterium psychrophilum]